MDVSEVLELHDLIAGLGDAVVDQMRAIAEGEPLDEQNSNALAAIRPVLVSFRGREIDTFGLIHEIDEHLAMEVFSS